MRPRHGPRALADLHGLSAKDDKDDDDKDDMASMEHPLPRLKAGDLA